MGCERRRQRAQLALAVGIRLLRQPVQHPQAVTPHLHHTGVAQDGQVSRHRGLRQRQHGLDVTDAQFPVCEQRDDTDPGFVGQRFEEPRQRADIDFGHCIHCNIPIYEYTVPVKFTYPPE